MCSGPKSGSPVEIHLSACASCNSVITGSRNKVLTYVVLVILIALWAMVLLPPYLKDRRASGRTFRSMQGGGVSSAQRFLPLQQASIRHSTSAVSSPTGMRTSGVNPLGTQAAAAARPLASGPAAPLPPSSFGAAGANNSASNVVQLRPLDGGIPAQPARSPLATSAAAYLDETPLADESALHQAWETSDTAGIGMPSSTSAARERRRQVLIGLTGLALVTLMFAIFAGGRWIAAHVLIDMVMVGYVILLVRHRQLMADRITKVEPIRPPVTDQAPASIQLAPPYLLRENTGS